MVELIGLPCLGRPTRLGWMKYRWACRNAECGVMNLAWDDVRITVSVPGSDLWGRASSLSSRSDSTPYGTGDGRSLPGFVLLY